MDMFSMNELQDVGLSKSNEIDTNGMAAWAPEAYKASKYLSSFLNPAQTYYVSLRPKVAARAEVSGLIVSTQQLLVVSHVTGVPIPTDRCSKTPVNQTT
jgi:hypothetical protein